MIDSMQAAYVRLLRKIKSKSDGESEIAKEIVHEGVKKLLTKFPDHAGIIEAARKLFSTAIKTYNTPNAMIHEIAKNGGSLLFEKYGNSACKEIFLIYSSGIVRFLQLNAENPAKTLTAQAVTFFTQNGCLEQSNKIEEVLTDPRSKSEIKLF